jgi:hypothetical protein
MARWKVTAKHYVHAEQYGQPTEWERQETNQDTGRMFRKSYRVPLYIDPDDRFCINKFEGFCVVARKGTEKPGDIVFFGPPTPDMEPMDEEAQAETDAEKHKWVNPIDSLAPEIGQEFGKQLLEALNRQVDAAGRQQSISLKGASSSDIDELKKMVAAQQEMINKLMGEQAPAPVAEPTDLPLVEPDVPLKDIDPDALPAPPPLRVDTPRHAGRR